MKQLTPVRSIKKYCLWCCKESREEVKCCPVKKCAVLPYRMGKRNVIPRPSLRPLKAIRARCLDCQGNSRSAVASCTHLDCELFSFRSGHRPAKEQNERGKVCAVAHP